MCVYCPSNGSLPCVALPYSQQDCGLYVACELLDGTVEYMTAAQCEYAKGRESDFTLLIFDSKSFLNNFASFFFHFFQFQSIIFVCTRAKTASCSVDCVGDSCASVYGYDGVCVAPATSQTACNATATSLGTSFLFKNNTCVLPNVTQSQCSQVKEKAITFRFAHVFFPAVWVVHMGIVRGTHSLSVRRQCSAVVSGLLRVSVANLPKSGKILNV